MKTLFRAAALASLVAAPAFAQSVVRDAGPNIVVPAHDIERGQVIADADLQMQTVAPERLRPDIVRNASDLEGREARRLLRAGEPVRVQDVRMPILVTKGATVTMTFAEPGIVLTAVGRAMSDGGMDETIVVQNPVSFRQVSCIVTGAGEVRAADAQVAVNP